MESVSIELEVLAAMFPNIQSKTISTIHGDSPNMMIATARCAAKSNPKLNLASLRTVATDPAAAINEAKDLAEEVLETHGAEIYDVPNATEYSATIVPVPCDTTRWDRAAFYNNREVDAIAVAPGSVRSSLSMSPRGRKSATTAATAGGNSDGVGRGSESEVGGSSSNELRRGGSYANWAVPSLDTTPARDVCFTVPEAEVKWVKPTAAQKQQASLKRKLRRAARAASNDPLELDDDADTDEDPPLLVARRWELGLESNKGQATAVSRFADVFDPETMECSLARELHNHYHREGSTYVEASSPKKDAASVSGRRRRSVIAASTASASAGGSGGEPHAHQVPVNPDRTPLDRAPPGPEESGTRDEPLQRDKPTAMCEDFVVVERGEVKVDEIIPQVLPFLRKFVVGQVVIPETKDRHVSLPIMGKIPFTTQESRITSAEIPDDGAVVNVSCKNCFRIRLRQIKFTLEPCHFTYRRSGVTRNGILDVVVKRAHLRLGMDVKISAFGRRTAEVYMAKLRLKKFNLKARMKYSPLVNAGLNVARGVIKQAIEEELTKSLVGEHDLATF